MSTFVSIGNDTQDFSRLLDEVKRIVGQLPRPVIVQHRWTPFAIGDVGIIAAQAVCIDFATIKLPLVSVMVHALISPENLLS